MKQLIAALGNDIKETGVDRWMARCPVHNDKDFATSIKLGHNGYVVAHCHSCGANGLDIYKALGIDLDELFGGQKEDSSYVPRFILEQYNHDLMVIGIYEGNKSDQYTLADKKRYRLAVARSNGIKEKYRF